MKFLKLEILNLASLDRPDGEIVNFDQGALGDSTIFSIVGPTGSGKSTLLDAICLALYGNAPRYPLKKGERNKGIKIYGEADDNENGRLSPTDPRNILTRGKKNGYSKLSFVANNGTVYRAEWHVAFRRTQFDTAKTYLFKLVTKNGITEEEVAEWNGLPTIIGLDYDQFLRTVLIAQGSFASFIKADENDRFVLLEKLIGCETLYTTISAKIKQKRDDAKSAYETLVASYSVQNRELIKPEELQKVVDRILELEEEERNNKIEFGQVNDALGWYAQEKKYNENLKTFLTALEQARKELLDFKEHADRLNLYDSTHDAIACFNEILSAKNTIREQEEALKSYEEQICTKKKTIEEEKNKLSELVTVLEKAKKDIEKYSPHINKARTIKGELEVIQKRLEEKIIAEQEAETAMNNACMAVQKNAEDIQKADRDLKQAEADYVSLKSDIDEARNKKVQEENQAKDAYTAESEKANNLDIQTLQTASKIAQQKKNDIAKAVDLRQEIGKTTKEVERLEKENGQLLERVNRINEELNTINPASLKDELETLRETRTLMSCENWDKHRALLKDGEQCPLCGSIEHPFKDNEKLEPVLTRIDKLIIGKEGQLKISTELEQERGQKKATMITQNTNIGSLKESLTTLHKEWFDIQTTYPDWPVTVDALKDLARSIKVEAEKADKDLTDYNNLVTKIDNLRIEKEKAEEASRRYKEETDKDLELAKTKIANAKTVLETEKGKTENLSSQADEKSDAYRNATTALEHAKEEVDIKISEFKSEIGDHDPDQLEKEMNKCKDNAEENLKKQENNITRLDNERTNLDGKAETTRQSKYSEEQRLANKKSQLSEWLHEYNSVPGRSHKLTVQDIAVIHGLTEDWEALRVKQEALKVAVTTAITTYENEKMAHEAHQNKKPELTEDQLEARKRELENTSSEELVDLKMRKKRHDTAMEAIRDIFQQKQEAELLKMEWDEIADAIGADGKTLRKIAQCYTLRFLIEHANDEIRKFNTRYELMQVKNSLGIRVIDHDRADDIRDTTSLSGGETFIVSLGLALGLSSLSSRNISFENLFIDEGFGTLDPDTLSTVLDSLAMLQSSQGKKVGIISHTDTMAEHITTQIRIVKDGNSGSSHIEFDPNS